MSHTSTSEEMTAHLEALIEDGEIEVAQSQYKGPFDTADAFLAALKKP